MAGTKLDWDQISEFQAIENKPERFSESQNSKIKNKFEGVLWRKSPEWKQQPEPEPEEFKKPPIEALVIK